MKRMNLTLAALAAIIAAGCFTLIVHAQRPPAAPAVSDQSATAGAVTPATATWLTDFAAAQQKAKAGHKSLLLDFTGSDWCGWCMKLDREIFATPEFREFADKNLVLVKVDFPRQHPQSAAEQAQNQQLAAQYQVQGFPTLVVLNSDGHQAGTLGYMRGGPQPFLKALAELIAD
jgi:thioredoxin-related protein